MHGIARKTRMMLISTAITILAVVGLAQPAWASSGSLYNDPGSISSLTFIGDDGLYYTIKPGQNNWLWVDQATRFYVGTYQCSKVQYNYGSWQLLGAGWHDVQHVTHWKAFSC